MKALLIAFALAVPAAAQGGKPVYLDPSQPMERRIADVISQMTLEEKAAQLNHLSSRNDRLHIPAWGGWNSRPRCSPRRSGWRLRGTRR
jgi:beta-glucosidase